MVERMNVTYKMRISALERELISECERAMAQREEFIKTGFSTAGHSGSHDTCFGVILEKHIQKILDSDKALIIELCAAIAANHGASRPLSAGNLRERIYGRWEGEQAASGAIAAAIRALGKPLELKS